jgi:hypothetical protein
MKYFKFLAALLFLIVSQTSIAGWLDTSGKVTGIVTYMGSETILVTLSSPGTHVAECSSKVTFAISSAMSTEGRSRMYAMLLSAQATGRNITVSYNEAGSCEAWGANQNVYRRIVRLR